MVDTPESLREFIRKYNFPEDVEVRYCSKSEAILSKREGRLVIPLIVIVKRGDKIPISCSPIFFATLRFVLTSAPILFRIVSSVDTLN